MWVTKPSVRQKAEASCHLAQKSDKCYSGPPTGGGNFVAFSPPETVRIVRFIKRSQELGFTLDEIEEFLLLREGDGLVCADAQATATRKMEEIEEKIKKLRAMKKAPAVLVKTCESQSGQRECPTLDSLDDKPKEQAT